MEIASYGNCPYHGSVVTLEDEDILDLEDVFEGNWSKMVFNNCSFPLHRKICTCGPFYRKLRILPVDHIRQSVRSVMHAVDITHNGDPIMHDWLDNRKQMLRQCYRSRRKNDRKERKSKGQTIKDRKDRSKTRMRPHSNKCLEAYVNSDDLIFLHGFHLYRYTYFDLMEPQSSEIDADIVDTFVSMLMKAYTVYKAKQLSVFLVVISDLLREHVTNDVYVHIADHINNWLSLCGNLTLEDVVSKLEMIMSNWTLFQSSELYPLMGQLFSLMSILFMTPSEFLPSLLQKKEKFFLYLRSIQKDANDVITWMIKTLSAIFSSIKKFRETGDIIKSFCIVTPYQQMCSMYDDAMLEYSTIYNGTNLRTDVGEYFDDVISKMELLIPALNMIGARECTSYISRLRLCKQKLLIRISGKNDTMQGFAVALTGSTGCGKTSLADALLPFLLKINGFPHASRHIVTPNLSAKHWDGVSNDTFGMRFDDPDFLKAEYMDMSSNDYMTKIGRVLNNAAYFFEMADIEEKGVTLCQVMVAILTSNSTEYGVDFYAKEPSAIHRRIQYHVDVRVKDDYCIINNDGSRSTIIDSLKVKEAFGDEIFADIYVIDVYECQVLPSMCQKRKISFDHSCPTHQSDKYCFAHSKWVNSHGDDIRMKGISITTFLAFLSERSGQWFECQKALLDKKARLDDLEVCEDCAMPMEKCICDSEMASEGVPEDEYEVESINDDNNGDDDELQEVMKKLPHGIVPQTSSANDGPYPCFGCGRGFHGKCLWVFIDDKDKHRGLCRSCLAFTRLTCRTCRDLSHTVVGMKRFPKRTIPTHDYCKCGLKPHANQILDHGKKWVQEVVNRHLTYETISGKVSDSLKSYLHKLANGSIDTFRTGVKMFDDCLQEEVAQLIHELFKRLLKLIRLNGLDDMSTWIPTSIEGTNFGAYLHSRTRYGRRLAKMDKVFSICSGGLTLLGYLTGNTTVKRFGYLTMLSSFWSDGKPVSTLLREIIKTFPNEIRKITILYGKCNSELSILRKVFPILRSSAILILSTLVLKEWGIPFAFLLNTIFYDGFFSNVNNRFHAGDVLSKMHALFKQEPSTFGTFRDDVFTPLAKNAAISRVIYLLIDSAYSFRHHTGLNPQATEKSIEDYASLSGMSKHYYKKEWSNLNLDPLPVAAKSTPQELLNKIGTNLLYVENFGSGCGCCAWALTSKLVLLPRHFISDKRVTYEFKRKDDVSGLCGNAKTKAKFSRRDVIPVAADLCVVEVHALGDFANLCDRFLHSFDRIPRNGLMVTRDKRGILNVSDAHQIQRDGNAFSGLKRDGELVTWDGLFYVSKGVGNWTCMSPIISVENPSAILGFHLGGNDVGTGVSTLHTQEEVKSFIDVFRAREYFVDTPASGSFKQQQYGRCCVIQGIHPNSVAASLCNGEYKLFGSTGLVVRDNHDIIDTPISKSVYEEFGIVDRWDGPDLKGSYSERGRKEKWLYTLEQFANSKDMVGCDLLRQAFDDYMDGFEEFYNNNPPSVNRLLTDKEVVNGIDGCDFIGPMLPNTSVGFPLSGPKRKYMESVEIDGQTRNVFVTDMFYKQSLEVRKQYLNGYRTYPVSKTFVKIEPTKISKKKCRLVNGAPLHFQMLVRKVALPVAKYICEHKDYFECGVGTVPYGKDWSKMFYQLMANGNRIIAADYKGYDMNTSAQLVSAAFAVLIKIARKMGWHEDDIKVLQGLAADIIWPVLDVNGDILMMFGGTVSGHNLTTIINSIVNSLLLRVAFYEIFPKGFIVYKHFKFRDVVRLYVYGDDLIGSVKWIANNYNNISIARSLGNYGLIMTPFDKSDVMKRFDDIWKVEFLKRRFSKTFFGICGPLREESIFKRLVSIHKPKSPNTMYTVLPDNIESALIEWFYFGERVYNLRRKKLKQIVSSTQDELLIAACARPLGMSYKARVHEWRSLYS